MAAVRTSTPILVTSDVRSYASNLHSTRFEPTIASQSKIDSDSVGSYVIPWESHVNSCHLCFSCSEFYADSKKIGCLFFNVTLNSLFHP